jgi:hypothetical protein
VSVYDFDRQLRDGLKHEAALDAHFSQWYAITRLDQDDPAVPECKRLARRGLQLMGVDRIWERAATGERWTVEYKSDTKADATGNAFIETVSVDTQDRKGWAYTSIAQLIVYYVPQQGRVLVINVPALRIALRAWPARYPVKYAENRDYKTHGLLVPLRDLAPLCIADLSIGAALRTAA